MLDGLTSQSETVRRDDSIIGNLVSLNVEVSVVCEDISYAGNYV